jgi:hypothetical protein
MTQQQINYLAQLHTGQWFGFNGEQFYKNMWVEGYEKPTMEEIEQGMVDLELAQWRQATSVELYKVKIVLDQMGDLDFFEDLILTQSKPVQIAWNSDPMVRRLSPTAMLLTQAKEYTDEQVDEIFKQAKQVQL